MEERTIVFRNPEGKIAKYKTTEVAEMMIRQRQDTFKSLPSREEVKEANKYSYTPIGIE